MFEAVIFSTARCYRNERKNNVVRRCGGNQPAALTSGCYLRGMQRQLLLGEGHSFAEFLPHLWHPPREALAAYAVRATPRGHGYQEVGWGGEVISGGKIGTTLTGMVEKPQAVCCRSNRPDQSGCPAKGGNRALEYRATEGPKHDFQDQLARMDSSRAHESCLSDWSRSQRLQYTLDVFLLWLGIPKAATVFNDLTVGILGALLSLFYMSSVRTNQIYMRAKERMILTAELNSHVRSALTAIRHAASQEDMAKRIQEVDEAVEQIERVLFELVPTVGRAQAPRSLSAE